VRDRANNLGDNPTGQARTSELHVPISMPVPGFGILPIVVGDLIANERDWYKFTLTERRKVKINVREISRSGLGIFGITRKLETSNGANISDSIGTELEPGEYFIEVRLNTFGADQRATYAIQVDTEASASSNNNSGNGDASNPDLPPPATGTDNGTNGSTDSEIQPPSWIVDPSLSKVYSQYSDRLGAPISNLLSRDQGGTIQYFSEGIIVKTDRGSFPMYGEIWRTYQAQRGFGFGLPVSVPQRSGDITFQMFESGILIEKGGSVSSTHPEIFTAYLSEGGTNGWMGNPINALITDPSGAAWQIFEHGYIYWNGVKAIPTGFPSGTQREAFIPKVDPINLVSRQQSTSFDLYGESLRLLNPDWSIGGNVSRKFDFDQKISLPVLGDIGKFELSFDINARAFISGGRFDAQIPSIFKFDYDQSVVPGSIINLGVSAGVDQNKEALLSRPVREFVLQTVTGL
jgi:hypothetical protein